MSSTRAVDDMSQFRTSALGRPPLERNELHHGRARPRCQAAALCMPGGAQASVHEICFDCASGLVLGYDLFANCNSGQVVLPVFDSGFVKPQDHRLGGA